MYILLSEICRKVCLWYACCRSTIGRTCVSLKNSQSVYSCFLVVVFSFRGWFHKYSDKVHSIGIRSERNPTYPEVCLVLPNPHRGQSLFVLSLFPLHRVHNAVGLFRQLGNFSFALLIKGACLEIHRIVLRW